MALISRAKVQGYLSAAQTAATTKAQGTAFEDLFAYVFGRMPGISVFRRNAYNVTGTEEIDIAFFNEQNRRGLYYLPNFILVECKNWSRPLGSEEVAWFDTKLRNRGLVFGIIFAAQGITGEPGFRNAAYEIVSRALAEGRKLIIFTRDDLIGIKTTDELNTLIKVKMCDLIATGSVV